MTAPSCGLCCKMWMWSTMLRLGSRYKTSILYPRDYNAVNVGGTVGADGSHAQCRRQTSCACFWCRLWRHDNWQPQRNEYPNPRSPYAVSRLSAEYYVRTIGNLWNIETVACASSTHMDPVNTCRRRTPTVVPAMYAALRGGTLVAHGDGQGARNPRLHLRG